MAKKAQASKETQKLLKLIDKYYADLAEFERQRVMFEMGTRYAFHRLMADAAKSPGWTLIAEHEKKVNGKTIRPDGTFKDGMNLVRGYWEAKDTADKLDAEMNQVETCVEWLAFPNNRLTLTETCHGATIAHGALDVTLRIEG
jgi:hypothetical protein